MNPIPINTVWKNVEEVTKEDFILSMDATGSYEFIQPDLLHSYAEEYQELFCVDTPFISIQTTLAHKHPVVTLVQLWYVIPSWEERLSQDNVLTLTPTEHNALWMSKRLVESSALLDRAFGLFGNDDDELEMHVINFHGQDTFTQLFDEEVHCVTLPRNNVLLTKQEGDLSAHWSGNSGRHGNKGVITAVIPDDEMPHDKEGNPIGIIVNPSGVPGRLNTGQVFETILGKVAKHEGVNYAVSNFETDDDKKLVKVKGHFRTVNTKDGPETRWIKGFEYSRGYHGAIEKALHRSGIKETTELFDPETGKSLGDVLVGEQYIIKHMHQVDKKSSSRSYGAGMGYDINHVPKGGGKHGSQTFGELGLYAMLAHGAVHNIRDALTYKSDFDQRDVWTAIQSGNLLPPPQASFAYGKFESYLKAVGINIEKRGDNLVLTPFTDEQVLGLSEGELKNPEKLLRGKDLKPEEGGLFDEKITGGPGGKTWSHFPLVEPVPNPIFEKAIVSLLGITGRSYDEIMEGTKGFNDAGDVVPADEATKTGSTAISEKLAAIDIKEELEQTKKALKGARKNKLDKLNKKSKYLNMLDKAGLSADKAYVLNNIAVLPTIFRPITAMEGGNLNVDGLNRLYRDIALLNGKLRDGKDILPDEELRELRSNIYEAVKSLVGGQAPGMTELSLDGSAKPTGILTLIAGRTSPKEGFFHTALLKRKQDLALRSVIVPDMHLELDQIGLPRKGAAEIYKPFVVRELVKMGFTPLKARDEIKKNTAVAKRALDVAVSKRPVLFKRDPVLHKFGIMAFKPVLHDEKAIHIHPLAVGGFGADFDGDESISTVLCWIPEYKKRPYFATDVGTTEEPCILASQTFWKQRRIDVAARFKTELGYFDRDGFFALCNLEDFPHGKLIGEKDHIKFYDVPEEIYVVAIDETTGEPTYAEVNGWSKHEGREIEVVTLSSKKQIITDDDERAVYGVDGEYLNYVRSTPTNASNTFVPIISDVSYLDSGNPILEMDGYNLNNEFSYFIGSTVGDGWVGHHKGRVVQVCLSSTTDEISSRWADGSKQLRGDRTVSVAYNEATSTSGLYAGSGGSRTYKFSASGPETSKPAIWLESQIGSGAKNKHLPPWVMSTTREFRLHLAAGLFDTDGSVRWGKAKSKKRQFQYQYSSISLRLVQELQFLLRTLSINSSITGYKSTSGGTDAWMLTLSIPEVHAMGGFPLVHPEKKEAQAQFLSESKPATRGSYSRYKLVPLPKPLAKAMQKLVHYKDQKSEYNLISDGVKRGYVSKESAQRILALDLDCTHPLFGQWKNIASFSGWYEKVINVEKTGIKEDGYDLTVPGFETFMSLDGIVLSNTMAVFLPVSQEAVEEAYKMLPSKNLFNDATGKVMYQPMLEGQLGMYLISQFGKDTKKKFSSMQDIKKAAKAGEISATDVVSLNGKKTTAGRLAVYALIPPSLRKDKHLYDRSALMGKKGLSDLLTETARKLPNKFAKLADGIKTIGFGHAYDIGFSFSLNDFKPLIGIRDKHMKVADAKVAILLDTMKKGPKQDAAVVDIYRKAGTTIDIEAKAFLATSDNKLFTMHKAGVKPAWAQLKQMILAPGLLADSKGGIIPVPVRRSYGEGLSAAGYWVAASGARTGVLQKVDSVSKPGALSKQLMNTMLPVLITADNCGTTEGINLKVDDVDIADRFLAKPVKVGRKTLKAGTVLTPTLLSKLKAGGINKVNVRSPLRCTKAKGICSQCYGLSSSGNKMEVGTNIGAISGQAIGERAVQISMKQFHLGGVDMGTSNVSVFDRLTQMLKFPKKIAGSATLATATGAVSGVKKSAAGGWDVSIGEQTMYVPESRKLLVKKGDSVKKGARVSDGVINPRDLLEQTNMKTVQNYLASSINEIYRSEGVKRRNVEVVTRSLTNLGVVTDTGDSDEVTRGDRVSSSYIAELNKKLKDKIKLTPVLRGVETLPLDQTTDWLARLQYRRQKDTIRQGVMEGWQSDIHGTHPIPGIVYSAEFGVKGKKGIKY